MNQQEFIERHRQIIGEYNVCFQDNCDAWWMVTGFVYYAGNPDDPTDPPIFQITGVGYGQDGKLKGDFEGYLKLLGKELEEHFKKTNEKAWMQTSTTTFPSQD